MVAIEWGSLFAHFLSLSLMAIGGAITTVPDMHRYLVEQQHWLTQSQFTSSIAIAQAAPGPNVTFVALLGWNLGLNAAASGQAAWLWGLLGAITTMTGFLLPSTILTFLAARWCQQNRERLAVRAFKTGLAPIVVALLVSTGWILGSNQATSSTPWHAWLLSAAAMLLVWRTRLHLLWILAAGALLGWFGWI